MCEPRVKSHGPKWVTRSLCLALPLTMLLGLAARVEAQVADVQVQPVDIRVRVGETAEVLASAFDRQGNLISGVTFSWTSSDPSVVTVQVDAAIPELAILTGVSAGLALIELRVGNLTRSIPVLVQGPAQPAQPTPVQPTPVQPALPDTVMAAGVGDRARNLAVRVRGFPFGVAPSCASGALVGGQGLVVTTYRAIRGATRIEVEIGGQSAGEVMVAHYDAGRDLAVLAVPTARPGDSLPLANDVADDQVVWSFGFPDCGAITEKRMRVAAWEARPGGQLDLTRSLTDQEQGAALITQAGLLAGLARGDRTAVPAPQLAQFVQQARDNARLQALLTPEDVGRRENHLFGSLAISSGVAGTVARVRPLEPWQWPETRQQGQTPFTFSGPTGRYTVELLQAGQVVQSATAVVQAGQVVDVALAAPVAAAQPAQPVAQPAQAGGGGGFPWPIAVLGVAGAGAAAFFLTQKKEPGGTGTNGTDGTNGTPQPGSITIRVPNP